jgi:hypothetical protein
MVEEWLECDVTTQSETGSTTNKGDHQIFMGGQNELTLNIQTNLLTTELYSLTRCGVTAHPVRQKKTTRTWQLVVKLKQILFTGSGRAFG